MKNLIGVLFLAALIIMSSCASMLNLKRQRVTVEVPSAYEVKVDGEAPNLNGKGTKYKVKRTFGGHQLAFSKEGFKPYYDVQGFEGRSALRLLSLACLIYPILVDYGPKSFNYSRKWDYSDLKLKQWPEKVEGEKEIQLQRVSVDVASGDFEMRSFSSLERYRKKEAVQEGEPLNEVEDLVVERTNFKGLLNSMLVNQGYVDTAGLMLKNSYANNLLVELVISNIQMDYIKIDIGSASGSRAFKMNLGIIWTIKDFYGEDLFVYDDVAESGVFSQSFYGDEAIELAIQDALNSGLVDFLQEGEVKRLLNDRSYIAAEEEMTLLKISESDSYVSGLAEGIKSSVTILRGDDGFGSGFIISNDGYIITNYHVVSGGGDLEVVFNDETTLPAEVIRSSKMHDLALIKVERDGLVPFKISSAAAEISEDVYAIGTPSAKDLGQTLSKGIVSGIRTGDNKAPLIQTDASINSGNSGGALVNQHGVVVGVVQAKVKGYGVEGIAFGIPASTLVQSLKLEL